MQKSVRKRGDGRLLERPSGGSKGAAEKDRTAYRRPPGAEELALEASLFGGGVSKAGLHSIAARFAGDGEQETAPEEEMEDVVGALWDEDAESAADDDSDEDGQQSEHDAPLFFEDKEGSGGPSSDMQEDEDEEAEAEDASGIVRVTEDGHVDRTGLGERTWGDAQAEGSRVAIAGEGVSHKLKKLRRDEHERELSGEEYERRLRERFQDTFSGSKWAKVLKGAARAETTATATLRNLQTVATTTILSRGTGVLSSESLAIQRLRDANAAQPSNAVVQSLAFHPQQRVLATAGLDKTLRLFDVDGDENAHVYSLHLPDTPLVGAQFTPDGQSMLLTGRRRFYYVLDLPSLTAQRIPFIKGRADERDLSRAEVSPCNRYLAFVAGGARSDILLVCRSSQQYIGCLSMSGRVGAVCFSGTGDTLFSTGSDGDVYQWDLRATRRCMHRFVDDGARNSTALRVFARPGRELDWLATGDASGVVNLYNADCLAQRAPRPVHAYMGLTTPVGAVRFSHDGQLLAVASNRKKDQLRMIHLPSTKAYRNWPTQTTPLAHVNALAFSSDSRYFAAGNDKGKALLWSLKDYGV